MPCVNGQGALDVRMLDLYCGLGGSAVGWSRAGFEVVGVDHREQPDYPFAFANAEVIDWAEGQIERIRLLFDAVSASPPCQAHSILSYAREGEWEELVEPTRDLLQRIGLPYVIENVPGAPLDDPVRLCGSAFGLDVRRHRLFESNVPLIGVGCNHDWQTPRFRIHENGREVLSPTVPVYGTSGGRRGELWASALGIDWSEDRRGLAQAVPPAYTEFLGRQLAGYIRARRPDAAEADPANEPLIVTMP